jgi:predicted DNA-binding transcriptional regulator AlpA
MRAVRDQVALHPATIYGMVKDGKFPAPIKMGRRSLWIESEVQAWIQARIEDSRMGQSMGQKSAA